MRKSSKLNERAYVCPAIGVFLLRNYTAHTSRDAHYYVPVCGILGFLEAYSGNHIGHIQEV